MFYRTCKAAHAARRGVCSFACTVEHGRFAMESMLLSVGGAATEAGHSMRRRPKIAIIGGGIAGLAAALALFRRGIEVAVYEQAGELSEIGAGVQMTPNAMKALF